MSLRVEIQTQRQQRPANGRCAAEFRKIPQGISKSYEVDGGFGGTCYNDQAATSCTDVVCQATPPISTFCGKDRRVVGVYSADDRIARRLFHEKCQGMIQTAWSWAP